jgi:hypothetical protein
MPKINDTYDSKSSFLKVEDLQKRKVSVTISAAPVEKVGEDNKIVLYFEGKEKKFPLNITNARMLEMLTGADDSDNWVGLTVTLKPDITTYQGKPTPCIRIDSELPPQQNQQPPRPQAQPAPSGTFHYSGGPRQPQEDILF